MNFEYVVISLNCLKARLLLPEEYFAQMVNSANKSDLALLQSMPIFKEAIDKEKRLSHENLTFTTTLHLLEDIREELFKQATIVIARSLPEIKEVLFSRMELEQIKQAARVIKTGRHLHKKKFRFLNFFGRCGRWVENWKTIESVEGFFEILKNMYHPYMQAFEKKESTGQLELVEDELEHFYFQKYIPSQSELLKEVPFYFSSQNDLVNINKAYLLRGKGEAYHNIEKFFIKGTGKVTVDNLKALVLMEEKQFVNKVSDLIGIPRKDGTNNLYGYLPRCLKHELLLKLKRATIINPFSIADLFLFIEEVEAFVSNLRLAISASEVNAPPNDVSKYFISTVTT